MQKNILKISLFSVCAFSALLASGERFDRFTCRDTEVYLKALTQKEVGKHVNCIKAGYEKLTDSEIWTFLKRKYGGLVVAIVNSIETKVFDKLSLDGAGKIVSGKNLATDRQAVRYGVAGSAFQAALAFESVSLEKLQELLQMVLREDTREDVYKRVLDTLKETSQSLDHQKQIVEGVITFLNSPRVEEEKPNDAALATPPQQQAALAKTPQQRAALAKTPQQAALQRELEGVLKRRRVGQESVE